MKLIVQVPCLNEEKTLPLVINSIPKKIKGVNKIELMIIDDGSTDRTVEVAKKLGVHHIIRHKNNKGLAAAFETGINEGLKRGADIIVNTDGDNQYPQEDIAKLIKPILDGTHDIVVADRRTDKIPHFSKLKKLLQKVGSNVVCRAAGIYIPDAPSGFRAYSRDAAMSLNIITDFSYCMETIIQAGKKRLAVTSIPIKTNPKTRNSRLFKNISTHVRKSGTAIIRSYTMYEPFRIFLASGIIFGILGLIPFIRFAILAIQVFGYPPGHIQSLIVGGVLCLVGILLILIGVLADLEAINRQLLEDGLKRIKQIEHKVHTKL